MVKGEVIKDGTRSSITSPFDILPPRYLRGY